MPNTEYLEIAVEKRLYGRSTAFVDEHGQLTIIEDANLDEDLQRFVHLPPQAARALRNLLNQPDVTNLIRQ